MRQGWRLDRPFALSNRAPVVSERLYAEPERIDA